MNKCFLMLLALTLSGCAFYEKKFVSQIVLDGTNYRGATYTDGAFYVNDEPDIRMRMGCFEQTSLGETVSLLIPFPILNEDAPHNSIAALPFSLTLEHEKKETMDLSTLDIQIELAHRVYPLRFTSMGEPEFDWYAEYEYAADLRCADIEKGILTIKLAPDMVRVYGVQFEEGIDRDFAWHMSLVT